MVMDFANDGPNLYVIVSVTRLLLQPHGRANSPHFFIVGPRGKFSMYLFFNNLNKWIMLSACISFHCNNNFVFFFFYILNMMLYESYYVLCIILCFMIYRKEKSFKIWTKTSYHVLMCEIRHHLIVVQSVLPDEHSWLKASAFKPSRSALPPNWQKKPLQGMAFFLWTIVIYWNAHFVIWK